MKYLKVFCENKVKASPEVIKWNSWDGEHLVSVHSAYSNPKTLYSAPKNSLFIDSFKIPLTPFRLRSLVYTTQNTENEQISYAKNFLFLAKNSIKVIPVSSSVTKVCVTYEFEANFIVALLFPLIKRKIKQWNKIVWDEDLPLKLRRQKALEYGFIDWVGLPNKFSDRTDKTKQYKTEIPVNRPKNLIQDNHPFCIIKRK